MGVAVSQPALVGQTIGMNAPFDGITTLPGYRDWKLISGSPEECTLNDIRATLGNDTAINALRKDRRLVPDGAVIARIAWKDVPSEENNKVFGRPSSFVAWLAPEWYLQFMVKDFEEVRCDGWMGSLKFEEGNLPTRRRSNRASLVTTNS